MLPEENISQTNIPPEEDDRLKEEQEVSSQPSQTEPEDILAETEKKAPVITSESSSTESTSQIKTAPVKIKAKFNFKILIIPLAIIVLLAVVYGGYWLVKSYWPKLFQKAKITSESEQLLTPPQTSNQPLETPTPLLIDKNDLDGDGLTNDKEKALGTDPNNPDTDNDGLFDKEELEIYQTDPLKSDTDNDGILDGLEVKRGDDPKDSTAGAKLFKLGEEIERL